MGEIEALIQSYTVILLLLLPMLAGIMGVLMVRSLLQLGLRVLMRKVRAHHPRRDPHRGSETT